MQYSAYVKSSVYLRNCTLNKVVFISQTHLLTNEGHFIEFGKHSGMVNTKFKLHFVVIRTILK
jgi:hypothetical protein